MGIPRRGYDTDDGDNDAHEVGIERSNQHLSRSSREKQQGTLLYFTSALRLFVVHYARIGLTPGMLYAPPPLATCGLLGFSARLLAFCGGGSKRSLLCSRSVWAQNT